MRRHANTLAQEPLLVHASAERLCDEPQTARHNGALPTKAGAPSVGSIAVLN